LDVGFRVFKVDSSNLAEARLAPGKLGPESLEGLADLAKPGRSAEDLLFECMLGWGLDLSLPIKKEAVPGAGREAEIYVVGDNALVAALGPGLSEGLALAMAAKRPGKALFACAGLASDALLMTAQEIFRRVSPGTALRAI
jgi:adenine-specific DNA-methyltransferase